MIHESWPWKAALTRDADLIDRWATKTRASERRSFLFESKVFLAAYALRKLDEAAKLSTKTLGGNLPIVLYPPTEPGFAAVSSHRYDDHFDFDRPKKASMTGRRLINVVIHSLVFVEWLEEDHTLSGFLVTSDQESTRGLVRVGVPAFTGLMRRAAADFPTSFRRKLDEKTGRWKTWTGHERPK